MRRPARSELVLLSVVAIAAAPAIVPVLWAITDAALTRGAWSDTAMGGPGNPARWILLARTLGSCALIAIGATQLARPIVPMLRRRRVLWAGLILAPMWIPPWLSYAALNAARSPDTLIGRALLDAALPDHRWMIILVGRCVAYLSLMLWSIPLSALIQAACSNPESDAAEELLATDSVGRTRRAWVSLRLNAPALGASLGAILLIVIGSSIPLHLAQIETDAIVLWRALADRTPDRWPGVWLSAWPQLIIAGLGACWIVRVLTPQTRPGEGQPAGHMPPISPKACLLAWSAWSLSALLPIGLMLWSLDEAASLTHWIEFNTPAIRSTALLSAASAVAPAVLALGIAALGSSQHAHSRLLARATAGACVFGFLVPGVLVGAAIARLPDLLIPPAILAGAARSACIGAIAGLALSAAEPSDARAVRTIDALGGAIGWIRVGPARAIRLALGVWAASFLFSLHEIESAVLVRAPGSANLPQQMLSDLHYARLEQLSAGGLVLGATGLIAGLLASILLLQPSRQPHTSPPVSPSI